MAEQLDEILLGFVEEMEGYIPALREGAGELRAHPDNRPTLDEMRRLVHIVRGAAAMLDIDPLSRAAKSMELALDQVREGEAALSGERLDALEATAELFEEYAGRIRENGAADDAELAAAVDELCARIEALPAQAGDAAPAEAADGADALFAGDMLTLDEVTEKAPDALDAMEDLFGADMPTLDDETEKAPDAQEALFAGDMLTLDEETEKAPAMTAAGIELDEELLASFNEEVAEHFDTVNASLLKLGDMAAETVPVNPEIGEELRAVRRAVHTVKGASAVLGMQHIADVGHRIEDVLDWFYEEAKSIGPEQTATLALVLDQFENLVRRPAEFDAGIVDAGLAELQAGIDAAQTTDAATATETDAAETDAPAEAPAADALFAAETPAADAPAEAEAAADAEAPPPDLGTDGLDVDELFAADAPAGMVDDQPAEDFLTGMGVKSAAPETEIFSAEGAEEMEEELFGSASADELFPAQPEAGPADAGTAEELFGLAAEAPEAFLAGDVAEADASLPGDAAEPIMTAGGFELDEELLASFREEADEHFETISGSLLKLGGMVESAVPMNPEISEELRAVRRAVHTVKGASAVLGMQHIADVGHRIEDVLDWFYEQAPEIGPEQMATLAGVLDQFEALVRRPAEFDAALVDEGLAELRAGIGETAAPAASAAEPAAPAATASAPSGGGVAAPSGPTMTAGGFELDEELLAAFTEEVNEHFETISGSLLKLGDLVEETVPMNPEISEELRAVRRAVHTVKGASAVIGLQHIADVGHRIEDVLDWFYEEAPEIGPDQMATLALVLDQFENLVRAPESYDAAVVDSGLAALHSGIDAAPKSSATTAPAAAISESAEITETAPEAGGEDAGSMSAALFSPEEQEMLRAGFMEEAEEHLHDLSRVLQSVEARVTGPMPMDAELREELREIRRSVHTIKGASAVIGLNDISGYAHKVEDFLDWFFEEAQSADPDTVALLGESLDLLGSVVENPASVAEERKEDIYARLNAARGVEAAPVSPAAPAATPAAPVAPAAPAPQPAPVATPASLDEEEPAQLTEQEVEELRRSFAEEADLHVSSLHHSVQFLSGHISGAAPPPPVLEETGRMYELLLALRKEARILGNGDVHAFAGMLANFLGWARTGSVAVSPALLDALGDSVDVLDQLLEDPEAVDWGRIDEVCDKLETLRKYAVPPEPAPVEAAPAPADIRPALDDLPAAPADLPASPVDLPAAPAPAPAAQPAKPAAPEQAAQTIRIHQSQLDRFINLANELLVGVSGFDRNMERFREALNELDLAARRLKDIALELETKFEVKALDQLTDHFDRVREESQAIQESLTADIRDLDEFDSLELDHYTQLNLIIRALNESAIDVAALQTTLTNVRSGLRGDIARQHRTVRELQVRLMEARLSPMSILTPRLSRTMRDAANRLKKRVRLVMEGDTVELDRLIWEKLADPFMHLVRNSVDHGIEDAEQRAASGKPAIATLKVVGEREGNHVVIRYSDDGRGLNLAAIREKARKNLGDEADDLDREQLIDLIFDSGFSTQKTVTQISGRGVGMDVVKQNVLDLQGTISVDTEEGRGTEFAIRVPLTLGLVRVLLVGVGGVVYGIPITEILEVRRVPRGDIAPDGQSFQRGGERTRLYDLPMLLALEEEQVEDDHETGPIIFTIQTEMGPAGIRIPRITGQQEVVLKGLGSHLRAVTGIAGAAVMGDGSVIPLLNMEELLNAYLIQGMPQMVQVREREEKPRPLTIMIVDDSISIRRVMSRLVANHGWVPVECKDGQDAFERLDAVRPDCILLDIEMPRMNGFEFLTIKANLPEHKDVPVIMLTSRSSDKHRNKALELGANVFLNKPTKDEDFVEAVLSLTGHRRGEAAEHRETEAAL